MRTRISLILLTAMALATASAGAQESTPASATAGSSHSSSATPKAGKPSSGRSDVPADAAGGSVAAQVMATGCSGTGIGFSGSSSLGGVIHLSNWSCEQKATSVLVIGTPSPLPIHLGPAGACGSDQLCFLSCTPRAMPIGPVIALQVETHPSLIGVEFCVQGICVLSATCIETTEMVTITITP